MDEQAALAFLDELIGAAGDDAAVVGPNVLTTDMLHATTDFPSGTTRYTAGWRAIGASLSDVAAMGAKATAAVAVYAAPSFDQDDLEAFLRGARDVCDSVGAEYVGGDLDEHVEFTVASSAIGDTETPVWRTGASVGETVCVTGTLGRSAAAIRLFERGDVERANSLFRFPPRVRAGTVLANFATAMMDSSDGLARSAHQLATASETGMALQSETLPIDDALYEVMTDHAEAIETAITFGEDFELVCTIPSDRVAEAQAALPVSLTPIGSVTDTGVTMDDVALADRGYTHGNS